VFEASGKFFFSLSSDSILFSDFFLFCFASIAVFAFLGSLHGYAWTDLLMSHSAVRAMAQ
jgi:hypothetical protein